MVADVAELASSAGEYRDVVAASSRPARLIRAHRTSCTQDEAKAIVAHLADGFGEPGPVVEFVNDTAGHCVPPGHPLGRPDAWVIRLPTDELYDEPRAHSRLRVGVVLHETAHWMVGCAFFAAGLSIAQYGAFERNHTRGHGPLFVRVLDDLIDKWDPSRADVPSLTAY